MIERINTSNISNKPNKKSKNNNSFKGIGTTAVLSGLRGLNNSPAIGACAVDLCSMVIPRTVVETKNRGKESGIETFFREGLSCLIHAFVGMIGLGAAAAISGKINEEYKTKAQHIFASGDTIRNMSTRWQNADNKSQKFFEGFASDIRGLNGSKWKGISKKAKGGVVDNLVALAQKTEEIATATGADKKRLSQEAKNLKNLVVTQIVKDTGAQASFKLPSVMQGDVTHKGISASIGELVDNAVSLSNSFKKQTPEKFPKFIEALSKNKTKATIIGLGICAALCMAVQPVNKWLTKRRTGSDGFVGVEKDTKVDKNDKKANLYKPLKTILGIAFPIGAIRTIGNPKNLISNVQFNSKVPTINQFKFLYGLTIGSRFMSARDNNELREAAIKDTLGFTNWLILGGMVSKLTARAIGGKDLINNPVAQEGKKGIKYAAKWLTQASVKSFDEVLLPKAKEVADSKNVKKFSQLFKNADALTKSKVGKIAVSQVAGYLYSGIVLGVGISKLNIFITKKLNQKKAGKTPKAEPQPNIKQQQKQHAQSNDIQSLFATQHSTTAKFPQSTTASNNFVGNYLDKFSK